MSLSAVPPTNLVRPLTPLLGRDEDLRTLERALDENRLVSLLGPAGIGKSRVAIALADEILASGTVDGVWFCDLSEARTTDGMCQALATTLGFALLGADPVASVATALRGRGATLLVLDNCEQVAGPAATVLANVLGCCPGVRCLATSQKRLDVKGGASHVLGPLSKSASVQLFIERATEVRPTFRLAETDRGTLEEIVAKLDNLPLAIELAAAQVVTLGIESLLGRLADRFRLLEPLRAAFDSGWDLLAADERAALVQASTFQGVFSLAAAEQVIRVESQRSVLSLLSALRDRSLVRTVGAAGSGDVDFCMYVSIRDYARGHAGDTSATQRHAAYFLSELERLDQREKDEAKRLRWLRLAHADLRSIAESAMEADDLDSALRASSALGILAASSGPVGPTLALLERALAAAPSSPTRVRAEQARALLLLRTGQTQRAVREYRGIVDALTDTPEARRRTEALNDLATALRRAGALEEAKQTYERTLAEAVEQNDQSGEARVRADLGGLLFERGETEDARALHERALKLHQALGNELGEGVVTQNLGLIHQHLGDLSAAKAHFERAMAIHRAAGHRRFEGVAHLDLATLSIEQTALMMGRDQARAAFELLESIGDRRQAALAQALLAVAEATLGETSLASLLLDESERELSAVGDAALLQAVRTHRGHVDLALAVKAQVRGDASTVTLCRERARARLSNVSAETDELRLATRLLAAAIKRHQALEDAAIVDVRAQWVRLPDGTHREVMRNRAQCSILAALIAARFRAPGEPVSRDALVQAGWGDERIRSDAASNRLQVAVSKLRKIGLRDVLLRRESGYLLDPAAALMITT